MRDIHSEIIEFKSYSSFLALGDELWSGAQEKWNEADLETREMVWDRVREWADAVGELPDLTQINDMIWFDCDDLFYPPTFTVEVWEYEDGSVGDKIEELTSTFGGLHGKDEAVGYAESLDSGERRITVTNDETGDVEEEW